MKRQKITATYAYASLTKDLQPRELANCFFDGKKSWTNASKRTFDVQQARKRPSRSLLTGNDRWDQRASQSWTEGGGAQTTTGQTSVPLKVNVPPPHDPRLVNAKIWAHPVLTTGQVDAHTCPSAGCEMPWGQERRSQNLELSQGSQAPSVGTKVRG